MVDLVWVYDRNRKIFKIALSEEVSSWWRLNGVNSVFLIQYVVMKNFVVGRRKYINVKNGDPLNPCFIVLYWWWVVVKKDY